jgi:DNA polymerase III epsilon subunit-like protein
MANFRKFVVFDFETDGKNPNICNPVEVAAVVIDQRNLEPIKDAEFRIDMKPPGIDNLEEYLKTVTGYKDDETAQSTVEWHAKQNGCEPEDILKKWREAPDQQFAWRRFSDFINQFNYKKTMWFAPVPCGANIADFDLKIVDRLNEKYGIKVMFWPRDSVDVQTLCFLWFENLPDAPKNYRMDTLREYFGMPQEGTAHNALPDCRDTANIMTRFLKLHRATAGRVKFKGAFNG